MDILGGGFGRTGTMSLRAALEELGFGPCYHFLEVILHPSHIASWQAAADGRPVDWRASFLKDYRAALDFPAVSFFDDLRRAFPDARVIFTDRDPERWYESTLETIYKGAVIPRWLTAFLPGWGGFYRMVRAAIWDRLFGGRFEDRAHAIEVYKRHREHVIAAVPADQLLVFEVKQGWEPLCEFLGVPVPDKPFPHINDRQMTKRAYLAARIMTTVLIAAVLYALLRLIFS
jgi:hypothetical protein